MLEIYNEKVRDLLNPSDKKGGLRVRQHPKKGFYADGLITVPVSEYKDIEQRMEEGTRNRTVAATNMNATSRYVMFFPRGSGCLVRKNVGIQAQASFAHRQIFIRNRQVRRLIISSVLKLYC